MSLEHICMGCMQETLGEEVCSKCGFSAKTVSPAHSLALKTVLKERYVVGKILIDGIDGITYIAYDKQTNTPVRIKEYYPASICARKENGAVRVKKDSTFIYNSGIMDFISVSDKLQELNGTPCIFNVLNTFEENGTAYRVTEYFEGISLREFLLRNGGVLTWAQAKPLFMPLIDALSFLHKAGVYHLGISPETVYVGRDGKIRLVDFCIANSRFAKSDFPHQLYTGFAALEQYGLNEDETADDLGEITDVYGLGATLFRTLIGNPPPEATSRLVNDNMSFPRRLAESIPRPVLTALAKALQIEKGDRTETIEEFKEDITADDYGEEEPVVTKKPSTAKKTGGKKNNVTLKAAAITIAAILLIVLILLFTVLRDQIFGGNNKASNTSGIPSIATVSTTSNTVSFAEKLYTVPDFTGKTFAEVSTDPTYNSYFNYSVSGKQYSSTVDKGKIISQSVAKDTNVNKGTEITFVVSLGPSSFKLPGSLKNKTKTDAYIKLLELGIEPGAIEFIEKYGDTATKEKVVIETSPALGTAVTTDTKITVFLNTNLIEKTESEHLQEEIDE